MTIGTMAGVRALATWAVLASVVMVPGATAVGASTVSPSEAGTLCHVTMENPHPSSTSGMGAVAKARFSCDRGSMTVKSYLINLYLCPQKVSGPESGWTTTYGCRVVAESNGINNHDQPFNVGEATVTRQVPAPGSSPAHGSGWWVACTQYYASIYSGKQRAGSVAVQFSA